MERRLYIPLPDDEARKQVVKAKIRCKKFYLFLLLLLLLLLLTLKNSQNFTSAIEPKLDCAATAARSEPWTQPIGNPNCVRQVERLLWCRCGKFVQGLFDFFFKKKKNCSFVCFGCDENVNTNFNFNFFFLIHNNSKRHWALCETWRIFPASSPMMCVGSFFYLFIFACRSDVSFAVSFVFFSPLTHNTLNRSGQSALRILMWPSSWPARQCHRVSWRPTRIGTASLAAEAPLDWLIECVCVCVCVCVCCACVCVCVMIWWEPFYLNAKCILVFVVFIFYYFSSPPLHHASHLI